MENYNFYIDTHAHLDIISNNYDDIIALINECKGSNINLIFNVSINFSQFKKFSEKFRNINSIYYTIGLSPNDINTLEKLNLDVNKISSQKLKNYLVENINNFFKLYKNKIIGIGEVGLDYYWNKNSSKVQKEIFLIQVEEAKKLDLPLILHIRDSFDDLYVLIKDNIEIFNNKIIFHCFSGDIETIKKFEKLNLELYYSFAGNITYPKARNLKDAFIYLPLDKILVETDSPFLTPVPKRGEKNVPVNIIYTYKYCSELKKISENILKEQIVKNVFSIFNKTLFSSNGWIY
ncbi:MAG: TatD family hydrolase [Spirochaetes bacterium]|nr:TatD family hydrolase [Spirochaetota bacterium]